MAKMRNIIIETLEDEFYRPAVDFNAETGICEISGESYLEEINDFYAPLIDWLKEFTKDKDKLLTFNFKLTYYNTSSSKKILEILKLINIHVQDGGKAIVNWYYEENDTDIIEDAEDFMLITGLKINMKQFEESNENLHKNGR